MNQHYFNIAKNAMDQGPDFHYYDPVFLNVFSELLVKDAMRILQNNGYDDASRCLSDVYFGIEDNV